MNQWRRMELPDGTERRTCAFPSVGKDVGLYLIPRQRERAWMCDFGHVRIQEETGVPYWESAFGIGSRLDGVRIQRLLRNYDIWFACLPPLDNGRTPPGFASATQGG